MPTLPTVLLLATALGFVTGFKEHDKEGDRILAATKKETRRERRPGRLAVRAANTHIFKSGMAISGVPNTRTQATEYARVPASSGVYGVDPVCWAALMQGLRVVALRHLCYGRDALVTLS